MQMNSLKNQSIKQDNCLIYLLNLCPKGSFNTLERMNVSSKGINIIVNKWMDTHSKNLLYFANKGHYSQLWSLHVWIHNPFYQCK